MSVTVFEDPSGVRWRKARLVLIVAAVAAFVLLGVLLVSILVRPALPPVHGWHADGQTALVRIPAHRLIGSSDESVMGQATAAHPARLPDGPLIRTAFVVQDDPRSVADLTNNVARLDAVFPDWFSFDTSDGEIQESIRPDVRQAMASGPVMVLPRLANSDKSGAWHTQEVSELIRDAKATEQFIDTLVERIELNHAQGVNVDIEQIDPDDKQAYVGWLDELAQALHRHGLLVTVDVPLNDEDAFDYEAIGKIADAVVVMGYDEHYATSEPGPIASQSWFADGVDQVLARIPAGKVILGLGAYGYDWTVGSKEPAADLGFGEVIELARRTHASVAADRDSVNPSFTYGDSDHARHQVWFLDAVSALNQCQVASTAHVRGLALWRLGQEDPDLWPFFAAGADIDRFDPRSLATMSVPQTIAYEGEGELLRVTGLAQPGRRELKVDDGSITSATYPVLPAPCRVQRGGAGQPRKIALTFDDGPDPRWTPRLLDVLKANGVHATFFVMGSHVQADPAIVRRIAAEGHLLGNHTFQHPDVQTITALRLRAELNATQRAIEWATGRQTVLFRAPFDVDTEPKSMAQLAPLRIATDLGYIVAGADIDSLDWTRPGTAGITRNVLDGIRETGSSVVLLHDGGGDRSQTLAAVARLIPQLKRDGYEFVTLDQLLGVSREALNPPAPPAERAIVTADGLLIRLRSSGWQCLLALFGATTALCVLRITLLGALVFRSRARHRAYGRSSGFTPPVCVIIPAYNESKVIRRTIRAVLASDYPADELRVMVVDDGSTDETGAAVAQMARDNPRVTLLTQPNGGKYSALNRGFRAADEEYVVTIDADTIVLPETVRHLMAPFADDTIDAVCGNVQVGNVNGVLTAFQDVEYVTSQNYDRRAFDAINCIAVVPGATGAWRRRSVLRVGGYSPQTLTEDADLTLTLLRGGGRIVYAPLARSVTEAPETVRALFKQRFRWSFGTLQCLWKHRRALCRGSLGWAGLPNMVLFQLLFPLLAPVGDLVMVLCLFNHDLAAIAVGYLLFLGMDAIGSGVAFRLDRRRAKHLWVIAIQRFFYRQFMYAVTFAAVVAALRGRRHGWNKLDRRGSVTREVTTTIALSFAPAAPGAERVGA